MRKLLFLLSAIPVLCNCGNNIKQEKNAEGKALEFIKNVDTATLEFLKNWNFTNRMNYYNIWTKVKAHEKLNYSLLVEPINDTTYIEIYEIGNFLKDYKVNFEFDTSIRQFYRLAKVKNKVISIYANGEISGTKNALKHPIAVDSLFIGDDPFSELKRLDSYKEKFNFNYCLYNPDLGNFIRFAYSNNNKNILYYVPNNLVIKDDNLFNWIDKLSNGKRLGKNWILVEKDNMK